MCGSANRPYSCKCFNITIKKIKDLSVNSVLKRYKEKSFARGAEREVISACKEINLTLEEFIKIGLSAMQKISNDLEL